MNCVKCGSKIPDGYEYCMKCGTKNPLHVDIPTATVSQNEKHRSVLLPFVIGSVGVIFIVIVIFMISREIRNSQNNGLFHNMQWGMDIESVYSKTEKLFSETEKIEDFEIVKEDRHVIGVIKDYEGRNGVSCRVIMECKNNDTLTAVDLVYMIGSESIYTTDSLENELIGEMSDKYGEYEYDGYSYNWVTENSKIILITATEDTVVISYCDLE